MTQQDTETAQQIQEHAEAVGAGRIAFVAASGFAFSPPDADSLLVALRDQAPQKYKLQRQSSGRWVDASKYTMLDASGDVIENIKTGHSDAIRAADTQAIRDAAEREPTLFLTALRTLNRDVSELLAKKFDEAVVAPARDLVQHVDDAIAMRHTRYLAASLDTVTELTQFPIRALLDGTAHDDALALIDARAGELPGLYDNLAAEAATAVNRGKIRSMQSRPAAAAEFAAAGRAGAVIKDLYTDMGALTYFDDTDIGPAADNLAATIRGSVAAADPGGTRNRLAVAMSVDPNYLRIYAPVLMHYAQQMPDVDHNIILCGDPGESLREMEAFRDALAAMNRSGRPDNIHVYQVDIPAEVVEPRTFYACARFFAVDVLLEHYPSLYVMDVDLTTSEDPRPFYQSVSKVPFAVPTSRGFDALSPWRRYMAGNLAVSRDALVSPIILDVQRYLAHGLTQPNSWMLDQNALSFAIERNGEVFKSLDDFRRPFRQPRFRSVWEKSFRL